MPWSLILLVAAFLLFIFASGAVFRESARPWSPSLIALGLACYMASLLAGGAAR